MILAAGKSAARRFVGTRYFWVGENDLLFKEYSGCAFFVMQL